MAFFDTSNVDKLVETRVALGLNNCEKNSKRMVLTRCFFRFVELPQMATAAFFVFRFFRWTGMNRGLCYFNAASFIALPLACKVTTFTRKDSKAFEWDRNFRLVIKFINMVAAHYCMFAKQNIPVSVFASVSLLRSFVKALPYFKWTIFNCTSGAMPNFDVWAFEESRNSKETWI